jgi:hypothetical protein
VHREISGFGRDVASQALGGLVVVVVVFLFAGLDGRVDQSYARTLVISAIILGLLAFPARQAMKLFQAWLDGPLDRALTSGRRKKRRAAVIVIIAIALLSVVGVVLSVVYLIVEAFPAVLTRLFS